MRRQTANAPLLLIRSTPEAATRPPHPLARKAELRGLRQPIDARCDALEPPGPGFRRWRNVAAGSGLVGLAPAVRANEGSWQDLRG